LQQPGLFELVQLQPYTIGTFPELAFQVPEIGAGVAVEEELQHQLDAGFAGYEGV